MFLNLIILLFYIIFLLKKENMAKNTIAETSKTKSKSKYTFSELYYGYLYVSKKLDEVNYFIRQNIDVTIEQKNDAKRYSNLYKKLERLLEKKLNEIDEEIDS